MKISEGELISINFMHLLEQEHKNLEITGSENVMGPSLSLVYYRG